MKKIHFYGQHNVRFSQDNIHISKYFEIFATIYYDVLFLSRMKPWLLTWQYMTFYSHFIYWVIMPLSKWNMAHFTGINEAPPNHQLRSRRQHGANSHSQFQKQENKNSTKDSPWSWVTEDINSPVPVPHLPTPTRPTVSISLQLCHANRIDSANLKNLICDYHP